MLRMPSVLSCAFQIEFRVRALIADASVMQIFRRSYVTLQNQESSGRINLVR